MLRCLFAIFVLFMAAGPAWANVAWPLKKSADGHYLVDQNDTPFLVNGDSPQSLMRSLSEADVETYFADREQKGINAVWIHLTTTWGPNMQGAAFTSGSDVSSPRESYFAHVDRVLNMAKNHSILIFLDISGANGAVPAKFTKQGATKVYNFGQYLGARYANQGNIIWTFGNDWRTYNSTSINNVILQQVAGIKETDTGNHLMTLQIYPTPKCSSDAGTWKPHVGVDSAYSYAPIYKTVKRCFNQSALPVVMFETIYETRADKFSCRHGYCGTPRILRSVEHWSILSGALGGQMYGNEATWSIDHADVVNRLNSAPQKQLINIKNLYGTRPWYNLVPDFKHSVAPAGWGTCPAGREWKYNLAKATCTTTALTSDGKLLVSYMERRRALTIDMSKLSAPVAAKWFNPDTGVYLSAGGPFINSGSRIFTPPPCRTSDWVLVLEAQ